MSAPSRRHFRFAVTEVLGAMTSHTQAYRCTIYIDYAVVFTANGFYYRAVFAVIQCPSVCHVRGSRQNE